MYSLASRTIDAFVVVLWHFIAIVQPVLNQHLGRRAGEKDWAAHPAIVAPSEILTFALSQLGFATVVNFSLHCLPRHRNCHARSRTDPDPFLCTFARAAQICTMRTGAQ
jgi:hypothetical protein